MGKRILIIGASGFIGKALYKELCPYFSTYGTYYNQSSEYKNNKAFVYFDVSKDSIEILLSQLKPQIVITCIKGNLNHLYAMHEQLVKYTLHSDKSRLIYLSSAKVFDGNMQFPASEKDKPISVTETGKHQIAIEKLIQKLPLHKYCILRVALVLGVNAPLIHLLKESIKHNKHFEVYSDLVINATTDTKLSQQVHYIINQNKYGIYHLGSSDLIHYHDLFEEIAVKIADKAPVFTYCFTSNADRYQVLLPKLNFEYKELQITISELVNEITLNNSLSTIKTLN